MTRREFTRQDDERLLALIARLEAEGVEVFIDENEAPRMTLADLIGPVTDKMRKAFERMVGGLS